MEKYIVNKEINYNSTLIYLKSMSLLTNEDFEIANKIIERNNYLKDYKAVLEMINSCPSPKKEKKAYIILGNIGSGKSTLIHMLSKKNFFGVGSLLIHEDVYKQILFTTDQIPLKIGYGYAKAFVGFKMTKAISSGQSIIMEMVPSSNEKLEIIERLKRYHYKIVICYIKTDDININTERVKHRILEGADYVSEEKVVNRGTLTSKNMPRLLSVCDELFIFRSIPSTIEIMDHRVGEEIKGLLIGV